MLFECLTSETEIFNSTFRTQILPKQLNTFYSFPEMVTVCVMGGQAAGKYFGEFCCYSSACFVVFLLYCTDNSPRSNKRRLIFLVFDLAFAQDEF